ncbi:histidinol-phosphatase [Boudabousia tangfeifanii]|uniref:D,D-heptose 1,7-bisphosphate phosphatase n=1 Tax=Boudabousia tangfeifanii TaxID=1912795 RepID=A0A1D9MJ30_9ACTO|nr:histidinol-phosphatase [Boudabousia tangfeifanii]AOZ72315.1 histidinol-phosphatase [Boudabousia tangfeifanii]
MTTSEPAQGAKPILFVDRDGTLITEPADYVVDSFEKLHFLPHVITSLWQLQNAGWELIIVTNQDGLGDRYSWENFNGPHELMLDIFASQGVTFREVLIDTTYAREGKATRKPGTALVDHLRRDPNIDWNRSAMVGDRMSDAEFGHNLGIGAFVLSSPDPQLNCGTWTWPAITQHLLAGNPIPQQ